MIAERLEDVRERVYKAALRSGRDPDTIAIVAVSKTHASEQITEVINAGQRILGESRVQEALEKIPMFDSSIEWHLVGHLQTNKVKYAVKLFRLIHSVDSIKLVDEVNRRSLDMDHVQPILLQVDVSGEISKHGLELPKIPQFIHHVSTLKGVKLKGLMTIPPYFDDPEEVRPYFRKLHELSKKLPKWGYPSDSKIELSMGMTHDFEIAIEEGATIVRIGTAIFGSR
ncbi:YggS family pyridoxal phosphate-dependent enzyme [bacterium]|nr:YggS family pyridoxal phosphate-dependent enzyme [candidate division CSSED10-310 bacterium]